MKPNSHLKSVADGTEEYGHTRRTCNIDNMPTPLTIYIDTPARNEYTPVT